MPSTIEIGRPRKPPTRQVRVRERTVKMLEVISMVRDTELPDLIDTMFLVAIEREYAKAIDELTNPKKDKKS